MTLNSAWIAALAALPCAALATALCHRALASRTRDDQLSHAMYVLLALTLVFTAVFAAAALIEFAQQTLLPQASALSVIALIIPALLLCAIPGSMGISRLCFLLRYALPGLLLVLTLASVPLQTPVGLFPLLGAGPLPLGAAALCMTASVSSVLMLFLRPPEIEEAGEAAMRCPIPGVGFFLWRVLAGTGAGIFLLFAASVCSTYEAISENAAWGARLRMICSGQPHEGIPQMMLTVLQASAMGLLAANMLCSAEQALVYAAKKMKRYRAGLLALTLLAGVLLTVLAANGFDKALPAAPLLAVPTAVLLIFHRRLGTAP